MADRKTQRVLLLIEQWLEDRGKKPDDHGAQSEFAREVGVTPSTINKIVNAGRNAGEDVRDKIAKALRLDKRFFEVSSLVGRPRYTDWVGSRVVREDIPEMATVTEYFAKHPEQERFRDAVNRTLNASNGEVPAHIVRGVVRSLEDLEEMGNGGSR